MYIPAAFRVEDSSKLAAFIQRHSFATFITSNGGVPFASHLPMLFRAGGSGPGTLVAHMARANPQWEHFASGAEALAIFHGPHSYISPTWYETTPAVPTWNYAAVHAYGVPRIIEAHSEVVALLQDTVALYERGREQPWDGILADDYRDKMIRGIVAFEMPIARLEGKYKLGQNRPVEDQQKVYAALSASPDAESRALAGMMTRECKVDSR